MRAYKTFTHFSALAGSVACGAYVLARLRRAEWLPAPGEILSAPPEQAIYGAVWLVAVSVTAWLALSTVLSVLAYASRIPSAIRAVEWMTIGPVRHLARRTAALILALGSFTVGPAVSAAVSPPVPFLVSVEQPASNAAMVAGTTLDFPSGISAPVPLQPTYETPEHPQGRIFDQIPTRVTPSPPLSDTERVWDVRQGSVTCVVEPGDSLWSIAAAYLADMHGEPPGDAGIEELWRQVINLNRDHIRSGNPDLIFPGELIHLPPLSPP